MSDRSTAVLPVSDGVTKEMLRHGVILFFAVTFVNVSNYLFHVAMSRLLGPASYGALGGILSILVWLTVCAGALQLVVAKNIVQARSEVGEAGAASLLRSLLVRALAASAVVAVVLAASSTWLARFLHLGTVAPSLLLALYVVPVVVGAVLRGALQGRLMFARLAAVTAGSALLRLSFGVPFVLLGWGVTGAVAASVVGELVAALVALFPFVRPLAAAPAPGTARRRIGGEMLVALLVIASFWAVVNMDTFLVRHFLPGERSGFYTAAAVAARMTLYFPAAVAMTVFPHFAMRNVTRAEARPLLTQSLLVVGALSAGFAVLLTLLRGPAVSILFGSQFVPSAHVLGALAVAMAMLAVVNVLVMFHVATETRIAWIVLAALVAEAVGITLWHGSLMQVAAVMLATSGGLLVLGLVSAYARAEARAAVALPAQDAGRSPV